MLFDTNVRCTGTGLQKCIFSNPLQTHVHGVYTDAMAGQEKRGRLSRPHNALYWAASGANMTPPDQPATDCDARGGMRASHENRPAIGPETVVSPPDDQKTLEWLAVLSAAGFDYRLTRTGLGWAIHIPADQYTAAHAEVAAYEAECRSWPRRLPREDNIPEAAPHTLASLWGVGVLLAFYVWCGPFAESDPRLRVASADANAIVAGQWWRPITALTLHSDFGHLAGNAVCLLLIGHAVCRVYGGGIGWLLMIGAGALGNTAVAWLFQANHISVGASTSSFGAIGVLVAHQSVLTYGRWHEWRSIWSRVWIPLGSGLALLALLGTGPQSDLAAHLLGFMLGVILATPFSLWGTRWMPEWGQRLLEFLCLMLVLSAWGAALRHAT